MRSASSTRTARRSRPIRGTGRVDAVHASGDRLALVGATQIALVGLDGDEPIVIPIEQGSTVSRVATSRSFTLVVAPAATGNLTLIDATDGTQLDVGDLAEQTNPMLLADSIRADTDGTAFAIGDGRNFQTVVVRFGRHRRHVLPRCSDGCRRRPGGHVADRWPLRRARLLRRRR